MPETAKRKSPVTFPPEIWGKIKAEACVGGYYPAISARYGPSAQVIANRAKFEQWPTPKRLARLRKEMGEAEKPALVAPGQSKPAQLPALKPDNKTTNPDSRLANHDTDVVSQLHSALLDLVAAPPADFQAAFAKVAQAAIAEGVRDVPAPRSIKELATWFDLWRKAAGLDAKAGTAGNAPLVNPLRTVSRRAGPVVEVEVEATPEPGSGEWEAWEV